MLGDFDAPLPITYFDLAKIFIVENYIWVRLHSPIEKTEYDSC